MKWKVMDISRRKFVTGLAALVAAPAVLRVAPIMPVNPVALVEYDIARDAYVEISMGYKAVRAAIDHNLYRSLYRPDSLSLIRMEDIQNRLFERVL